MRRDTPNAPAFWAEDLAISESEVARGERVPASEIHAELVAALADPIGRDIHGPRMMDEVLYVLK